MKPTRIAVLAVALAMGSVTLTSAAVSPLWSPKAQALADSVRVVPAPGNAASRHMERPIGNAKAWTLARSLRQVAATGPTVDLVRAQRPSLPLKHPRYAEALRELRTHQHASPPSH
ncbi:MAG: hypothetical protein KF833_17025 [Verrucomicrobiae bacterium]|nr:hypothetical protein [Verrucomicrobiae bacterium]